MADDSFPTDPSTQAAFDQAFAPAQPEAAPAAPAPVVNAAPVNVINPEGKLVSIPGHMLQDAMAEGYQPASNEHVEKHFKEKEYGSPAQRAITALEGVGEGATFGLSTGFERAAGVPKKDILARKETNPGTNMLGQMAALAIPGAPEAGILEGAGKAAAAATGLGEATALSRLGSGAVKSAVETMMVQGGDEASKALAGDPNSSLESAVTNVGLSGLLGGAGGAALGSVPALWHATVGDKVGSLMNTIAKRVGGVEGEIPSAVGDAISRSGMDIAPEVKAALSSDPQVQQMFQTLNQSDTTKSGQALQKSFQDFRKQAGDTVAGSFGKTIDSIPDKGEISKYEVGKNIGNTLADEYQAKQNPLTKAYDDIRNKYGKTEFEMPKVSADGLSIPGTADSIIDQIGKLADQEGWTASPSSDIMKEVHRVIIEVPELKNVKDLGHYITAVGNNMQSDPLNGAMTRAGGLIKKVLKETEADLVGHAVGSEEGAAAVQSFADARKAYAAQSQLKEAIDESLHARGSTSGYAKSIREMAKSDGETVLNRLSGKGDAALLKTLQEQFPMTAEAIRNYHIDSLLSNAKEGATLKPEKFLKDLKNLSPELRNFMAPPGALDRADAVGRILQHFNDMPHNFSNTARTADKLLQHIPGTAVGLATMMASHNPAAAIVLGSLTKMLAKDAPDAVRLATLKFLGSTAPMDAGGMKAAVDLIQHAIKGESLIVKGAKNIFKAGAEVLPQSMMPSDKDRTRLDKQLKALRTDQNPLSNVGGKVGHYLPEHGTAAAQTATAASNYLNTLRPNTDKKAPLDSKLPATPQQKANYNNALDIAEQPLVVLDKIKNGTLKPDDVVHLKSLYPSLYAKLQQKVSDEMINHIDKGETIPYKARLSLSMFLGQPLDSTMTPEAIMSAQPVPKMPPNAPESSTKRHTGSSLTKLPAMYQTPSQASQAHKESKN